MNDIVPELLQKIKSDFQEKLLKSDKAAQIDKLIDVGKANYLDANEYAIEVGKILSECFSENISADILPDGRMYYNIAERILNDTLGNNYELISAVSAQIQNELNKQAGISIKPIIPPKNQERINGIIEKISEAEHYEDVQWMLEEPVINYSQSIVDEFAQKNADFQFKAGLSPKIVRRTSGKCCAWCNSLAGTYDYADVKNTGNDVFRRHRNCRCTVEYVPGKGKKRENVWTHKTVGSEEDKAIRQKQYEQWEKASSNKPRVIHKDNIETKEFKKGSRKNYPINISDSNYTKFISTFVKKVTVIAGSGVKEQLNDAPRLESFYNQPKAKWQKVSGEATIFFNGKSRKAEIHWYEANGQREEIKVKRWINDNEG